MRARWKRTVVAAAASLIGLIGCGMVFVTYFMHAVYEEEEETVGRRSVPSPVLRHFTKLHPHVEDEELHWEFEEGVYEAEFVQSNGVVTEVVFQPNGTLDRIVTAVPLHDLPQAAIAYLRAQTTYDIIEPEKILRGRSVQYEAKLANTLMEWNCLFDEKGTLIRKTRDGPILE